MSLIALACYDTIENGRTELTRKTIWGLYKTVDFHKHRIVVINNASCEETKQLIDNFVYEINDAYKEGQAAAIHLLSNVGTAKAINMGWVRRKEGEHCIKIDNDVVIHAVGWVDELEAAIKREPKIGIIGLKRKDLIESTHNPDENWRSHLVQLAHQPGETWIQIEVVKGVMGTCKMINSKLIDEIGYLFQPTVYGFDDSLYSLRSTMAGFINCFLPHVNIDHIDPGGTDYTEWKQKHAGQTIDLAQRLQAEYINGLRPLYEAP